MFLRLRVCLLLLLGMMAGCGDSSGVSITPITIPEGFPPHGGTWTNIGGDKIIEVVTKKGASPITAEVSIYFYGGDFAPYHSMPDSAELWLSGNRKVKLEANGDALVTPTGPALFDKKGVEGSVLSVELDGEKMNIRIVQSER